MTESKNAAEQKAIERVITRLTEAFAPQVSDSEVTQAVQNAYHGFEGSKIRDFVPLLVENRARRALSDSNQHALSAPRP